jgi:hypothetical protein
MKIHHVLSRERSYQNNLLTSVLVYVSPPNERANKRNHFKSNDDFKATCYDFALFWQFSDHITQSPADQNKKI